MNTFSFETPDNTIEEVKSPTSNLFSFELPETEEDDDIISTDKNLIETPSTDIVTVDEQPTEDNVEVGEYSARDLTEDRFFKPIQNYMNLRFSIDDMRGLSRKQLVNKYLNNMRGFSGGNSWIAVKEISFLNSLDEDNIDDLEKLEVAGQAYTIFEGLETLFGDTDIGEKADILWDYTRQAIIDPVNLIGFGIGKFFAAGGTKVATKLAQRTATAAYKKKIAQGAAKKEALDHAEKVWKKIYQSAAKDTRRQMVEKRVRQNSVKGFRDIPKLFKGDKVDINRVPIIKNVYRKPVMVNRALAEGGAVTLTEVTASVGTELGYQNGLIKTTDREELDKFALGLAGLGGMFVGGLQTLSALRASGWGRSGDDLLALPSVVGKEKLFGTDGVGPQTLRATGLTIEGGGKVKGTDAIGRSLKNAIKRETKTKEAWLNKYNKGKTKAAGNFAKEMFMTMLMGDEKKGIIGLADVMFEQGYRYIKRTSDDRISYFMADAIAASDPKVIKKMLTDFQDATGITMWEAPIPGKKYSNKKLIDWTPEEFSDALAVVIREGAKTTGMMSHIKRKLGVTDLPKDFNLGDAADVMWDTGTAMPKLRDDDGNILSRNVTAHPLWRFGKEKLERIGISGEGVQAGQGRLIRALVSSPSTSYLNLLGWTQATLLNSATDMGMGAIYAMQSLGPQAFRSLSAEETWRVSQVYFRSVRERARFLLNPDSTAEAFKSTLDRHPELLKDLAQVLPGGIEDLDKAITRSGFDPKLQQTKAGMVSEDFVDGIQTLTLVKAQDIFTKSQEYVYQLDKHLRLNYKQGWDEFYNQKGINSILQTDKYKQVVAKASYETQRAIFGKSMRGEGALGEVAGMIEDVRKVTGIGMLVPFGRFFNNTIAHMSDSIGTSFIAKAMSPDKYNRSAKELAVRGAIGWSTIVSLYRIGEEYREMGLPTFSEPDDFNITVPLTATRLNLGGGTGSVTDQTYNFPKSHAIGIARLLSNIAATRQDGINRTAENKLIRDTISINSLTRTLNQTSDGLGTALERIITGEDDIGYAIDALIASTVTQPIAAGTRFLQPFNDMIGLARGSDFDVTDKKDGLLSVNNATRYMDQFLSVTGVKNGTKKQSASLGTIRGQQSRTFGVRETQLSATARVANMAGYPGFTLDERSRNAIAANRFNQLFHKVLEEEAKKLLDTKWFKEGKSPTVYGKTLYPDATAFEIRKRAFDAARLKAKKAVKEQMEFYSQDIGDARLVKFLDIEDNTSWGGIKKMDFALDKLQDAGDIPADVSLGNLTLRQLELIEMYLKHRKDMIGLFAN